MNRKPATLLRLCLYSITAGAIWRCLLCVAVYGIKIGYQFWTLPLFWLSPFVTAPVAFRWNFKRKMQWGKDWGYQCIGAGFHLVLAIAFGIWGLIEPNDQGYLTWASILCAFDAFGRFLGPEYPANPHIEWFVHRVLKVSPPEGVFAE